MGYSLYIIVLSLSRYSNNMQQQQQQQQQPASRTHRDQTNRRLISIIGADVFDPNADRSLGTKKYRIPEHQRFPSWPLHYKVALVDTIFKDYPIGAIILSTHQDTGDHRQTYYDVEDGQTRMTVLQEFILDKYKWSGRLYSELSHDERAEFNSYSVRVDVVEPGIGMSDVEYRAHIADMYERLNSSKPLTDNDKFHNRQSTQVMQFLNRLKTSAEFGDQIRKYCWATVGEGKTRGNLKEFVGVILAVVLQGEGAPCITTSYAQNGPVLNRTSIGDVEEARVFKFLRWYFRILDDALQYVTRPKRIYGRLAGICGMMVCDWIQTQTHQPHHQGQQCHDAMWVQYIKIQNSREHFERRIFAELPDGVVRNTTPSAINARISTVIAAYTGGVFDDYRHDAFALINPDAGSNPPSSPSSQSSCSDSDD